MINWRDVCARVERKGQGFENRVERKQTFIVVYIVHVYLPEPLSARSQSFPVDSKYRRGKGEGIYSGDRPTDRLGITKIAIIILSPPPNCNHATIYAGKYSFNI